MTAINVTQTTLNLSVKPVTITRTLFPKTTTLNFSPKRIVISLNIHIRPTTIKFYHGYVNITLTNVNKTPLAIANAYLRLNLDNNPQVDDPQIYAALLQIHNAIDALLEAVNSLHLNKVDK